MAVTSAENFWFKDLEENKQEKKLGDIVMCFCILKHW